MCWLWQFVYGIFFSSFGDCNGKIEGTPTHHTANWKSGKWTLPYNSTDNYIQVARYRQNTKVQTVLYIQHAIKWNKKPAYFFYPWLRERKKSKKTHQPKEIVSFYFESFNEMVHLICLQKWSLWFFVRSAVVFVLLILSLLSRILPSLLEFYPVFSQMVAFA